MKLKTICIIGLFLFVVSYWIFTQDNEFAHAQKPIDFAHWLNLIGAVFMGLDYFLWSNLVYTALGCSIFALSLILILNKIDGKQNNVLYPNL